MLQPDITVIKNILIRAPNWIGDAALCLPAIEALKAAYPQAEITALARPWVSPVFLNNPSIKRIIEYDKGGMHRGISGRLKLIQDIKRRGFDMAVLFQNAFEAALVAFMAGIPVRTGYARDFRGFLLTHPIRVEQNIKKTHQVFYYLKIAASLSKNRQSSDVSRQPKIYLTEEEKSRADDFLTKNGMGDGVVVGMAPGASYGPAKRWMADRFKEAAGRLADDYGAKLFLFGGKDDREICNNVLDGLNGLNLAGEIDLRTSIALLSRCSLFITNDSGPMHLAASLGVPTVAVFGSTDPKLTGPLGDRVRVVKKDIACSPCLERECKYGHYECMKMISVDDVYSAAAHLLEENKQGVENF
ncbi:MAG: lipopolysaccharide heptosyltransferase II [Deltaproteobacteria bacterium]|nr:lipopolysaccharide heptosyltransferase II [Deltaproteobacteria bacterium]